VLWCLQDMKERVTVPKAIARRAVGSIERMLEI